MMSLLPVLVPLVGAAGWVLGRKASKIKVSKKFDAIRRDYFVGLNYLINDQPDKAMNVLIKMLEVDRETVETHLALGSLFRRRGEVERAIRIHQNLIARPELPKEHRAHALSELGKDYMSAGVLNRAERIFLELIEVGELADVGLRSLVHIYEQQKDWAQAISMAQKLTSLSARSKASQIAHYYCELALQHQQQDEHDQAFRDIKRALSTDKNCARASIIQAELALTAGDVKSAIRAYHRVAEQDSDFLPEVIEPLAACYQQMGNEAALSRYLHDWVREYGRISLVLALSHYLAKSQGDREAIEYVAEHMRRHPSLRGLDRLIEFYLAISDNADTKDKLGILKDLVQQLLADKPIYRCQQCGFSGKAMYWQCPGCRHWSAIRPIHGLEGD